MAEMGDKRHTPDDLENAPTLSLGEVPSVLRELARTPEVFAEAARLRCLVARNGGRTDACDVSASFAD